MAAWWCGRPAENVWVTIFTSHAVMWTIFCMLLVASSGLAGAGITQIDEQESNTPELRAYQWQAILHCLATYFVLVPILGGRKKNNKPFIRNDGTSRTIADVVFYGTVTLSFLAATATPIVFQVVYRNDPILAQSAATGLNFASVVLTTTAAGQLAVRVNEKE